MTRQEKYPDTSTFHFHNQNPLKRYTTDCVIRAISTALDIPYRTVLLEMAEMQCETGYDMSESKLIDLYLTSKGWSKQRQPKKQNGTKYTGAQFCRLLKKMKDDSRIVANIGGHHVVAIIECKVYDTWNSTDGCIGNYWKKA